MWNLDLNSAANLIILISAVILAGKNIYAFFKKPVDEVKKKVHDDEEQHIEEVFDRKMPELLSANCQTLMGSLKEIKDLTLSQEDRLKDVQKTVNLLSESQKDMLRYDMNRIYYKYLPYKKILSADKKAFIKLYNDYKAMDGNTWIDALHEELIKWPIVESSEELKT